MFRITLNSVTLCLLVRNIVRDFGHVAQMELLASEPGVFFLQPLPLFTAGSDNCQSSRLSWHPGGVDVFEVVCFIFWGGGYYATIRLLDRGSLPSVH